MSLWIDRDRESMARDYERQAAQFESFSRQYADEARKARAMAAFFRNMTETLSPAVTGAGFMVGNND
jgi:pyridoxine 5'-phosphate synthase PdxJ